MAILKYQPPVNVITGTAGETISQYDICYLNSSDGKYYKSYNNGNEYQADSCVIALESMVLNDSKTFALGKSKIYNGSWNFTKGAVAYLSSTAGGVTTTKPVTAGYYIKPLGHFLDTNLLMFDPSLGYLVSQPTRVRPLDVVGGRLDLVSATQIKWSFLNSNQIRLFDGTDWQTVECSTEPTIVNTATDLAGNALVPNTIYDIFAEYSSGTAFTLVASRWQVATAGSSARTAAWAGDTAYNIGDRVSTGSPTHYYVCITAHTSHATTFSNDSSKWVDNGVAADVGSADFYGLYRHDGVLVSDSSTTGKKRRWLGIIYTYNNSGTVNFKDEDRYCFIDNFYNYKTRGFYRSFASQHTYAVASWRDWNNSSTDTAVYFVSAVSKKSLLSIYGQMSPSTSGQQLYVQYGIDGVDAPPQLMFSDTTQSISGTTHIYLPSIGYHVFNARQQSTATGTNTFYNVTISGTI